METDNQEEISMISHLLKTTDNSRTENLHLDTIASIDPGVKALEDQKVVTTEYQEVKIDLIKISTEITDKIKINPMKVKVLRNEKQEKYSDMIVQEENGFPQ